MTVKNLTTITEQEDDLDYILYDAISKLAPEKRVYLLEWIKTEFPELTEAHNEV